MYAHNNCIELDCRNEAISTFNSFGELTDKDGFCYEHSPSKEQITEDIYNYIRQHNKIVGLNASGIVFENIDLTDKRFYGCSFQHCKFINLHSTGFRSRMSMFDFAVFSDCNLLQSNMQFTSFASATFSHTLFTGSDLIQDNFNGIQSYQSSFDDADLYNSRFIRAKLIDTSFRNCNIKKANFRNILHQNVSFKSSNTREAVLDDADKAIFINNATLKNYLTETNSGGEK